MKRFLPFLYMSILYVFGFLLLLEWLYPLEQLTKTDGLSLFIGFAAFSFVLYAFRLKWWQSLIINSLFLLLIINYGYYSSEVFLSSYWIVQFIEEMLSNGSALIAGDWGYLTQVCRSVLMLILIWIMTYLIYNWFVVMKRIRIFVLATIVYLALINTFTDYQAEVAMVRTFIISFMALGMANILKTADQELIRFVQWRGALQLLIPLILIIFVSVSVGLATPTYKPQWPDPVPLIKDIAGINKDKEGNAFRKVGYGVDDSKLGGSFAQDHSLVFQAEAEQAGYWRVATRTNYTGKGWESDSLKDEEAQTAGRISLKTFTNNVPTERKTASIKFASDEAIDKIVYPYGIREIEAPKGVEFKLEALYEAIQPVENNIDIRLKEYNIVYDQPKFSMELLKESGDVDPAEIKALHTNLPKDLPKRIGKLAKTITKNYDNRFEKVQAVEQYFNQNGFKYDTKNVAFPEADQDYVDQFLFETKLGYCDNFSTSMVVMLRTLDIPARWVKGFTSGEKVDTINTGMKQYNLYEITNANAHSWVEVYFPKIGWVQFEPTQGFTNLTDITRARTETNEQKPKQEQEKREEKEETRKEAVQKKSMETKQGLVLLVAIFIFVAILGSILFITRLRWQTMLLLRKLTKNPTAKTYALMYHHILKVLSHKGLEKRNNETLRAYAMRIDGHYKGNELTLLTSNYEQLLYNKEETDNFDPKMESVFKSLLKRIMA